MLGTKETGRAVSREWVDTEGEGEHRANPHTWLGYLAPVAASEKDTGSAPAPKPKVWEVQSYPWPAPHPPA